MRPYAFCTTANLLRSAREIQSRQARIGPQCFDIDTALEAASLTIQDIDRIAITSMQDFELMTNRIEGFEI